MKRTIPRTGPVLFCKVAWLPRYEGEQIPDPDEATYKYIRDFRNAGERFLFKPYNGVVYGYVHVGRKEGYPDEESRSLRIEKLGAKRNDKEFPGVRVFWVAHNKEAGSGIRLVGAYWDATVHRVAKHKPRFGNITATHFVSIPAPMRPVLKKFPLRWGNIWYAENALGKRITTQAVTFLNAFMST